jgi:hypothetical protein
MGEVVEVLLSIARKDKAHEVALGYYFDFSLGDDEPPVSASVAWYRSLYGGCRIYLEDGLVVAWMPLPGPFCE